MHSTAREPAPLSYFKRVQPGDVGYVRTGDFHLLFSAGSPLGGRRLGIDVPLTFNQLDVGPIINRQPRLPGCLSTDNVRTTRARLTSPGSPRPSPPVPYVCSLTSIPCSTSSLWSMMLQSSHCIPLQLTGERGAALVTKYQTHREDIQRVGKFENYMKRHYNSWVAFARETGHGNNINPVLITGVDMTRDFAMMSYSNDDDDLGCEFTTSALGEASASVWGTWHTVGPVHTNCGPQLHSFPSPQIMDAVVSNVSNAATISDEYDQCVFIRYYAMRKRLGIPKVIKAGAGPHDLGPRDHQGGRSQLEARSPSDSGSDIVNGLCRNCGDNDKSSVTSVESDPNTVIHNTTAVRPSPSSSIQHDRPPIGRKGRLR